MTYTWAYSSDAPNLLESSVASSNNSGTVESNQPSNSSAGQNQQTKKPDVGVLMYPAGLLQKQSDYFQIKAIEYTPPNKKGDIIDSFYQTQSQEKLRSEKSKGMVVLPMPSKVTDVNGANWGEGFLNPLQAVPVGVFGASGSAIENIAAGDPFGAMKGLAESGSGALKSTFSTEAFSYGAAYATAQALSKVQINIDPNELLSRTQGTVSNPNGELLFKGPRLRSYTFTYRLIPRNKFEAKIIRRIVRFLKESMLPTKNGILLSAPYVFFLEYKRKSGGIVKSINKFKPCALTDFNVDNTPGEGWNSYYDENEDIAQPIATTIQMNFTELTPIFRESYDEFDSDDVGY